MTSTPRLIQTSYKGVHIMSFMQGITAIDLWVKRATPDVPNDGKYHIVQQGVIVASYRGEARAITKYRELVAQSGYTPPPLTNTGAAEAARRENLERGFNEAEDYWNTTGAYRKRGGHR